MIFIVILTAIALFFGILIYFVNKLVPTKVKGIEKTEEIAAILPGMNCGACGKPGCFAFAQMLTEKPELIAEGRCTVAVQDETRCRALEKALGITLDAAEMNKRALVHCNGNSDVIYDYSGVETCKAAALLLKGYKKCPYACLSLGDCVEVCPQRAIFITEGNGVAVVDREKCTGCGLCVAECPQKLIELVPAGTKIAFLCNYGPLRDIPGREKCEAGCIHCRKCFKICEDEAIIWNKERVIPEFDIEKCLRCLKCIEACEQNTLADFTGVKVAEPAFTNAAK